MGAIQTLGFGFGPAAAAQLLVQGNFTPVIWGSCLVVAVSLAIVIAGLHAASGHRLRPVAEP
jgi:hypothetical protein